MLDADYHTHLPAQLPPVPDLADRLAANPSWHPRSVQLRAHLRAGYVMLAARALGYAVGTMEGFKSEELEHAMFPDRSRRSFLLLNVGHATDHFPWARGLRLGPDIVALRD